MQFGGRVWALPYTSLESTPFSVCEEGKFAQIMAENRNPATLWRQAHEFISVWMRPATQAGQPNDCRQGSSTT
eukprot:1152872-Pelagomonas_calceolata.AAC.14